MNKPLRHGENLLLPVSEMPEGKATSHKSYVVGHSETGHHHVLEATKAFDVLLEKKSKELFIELKDSATIVHKKTVNRHNDLTVKPGIYKVIHKLEYDPFTQLMRAVWD